MSNKKKTHHNDSNSSRRTLMSNLLVTAGLLSIMTAAFLPLIHTAALWTRYLYAFGAVLLLSGRFVAPRIENAPIRLRRLIRIEIWTALIFVAGAVFMFLPSAGGKDWIAFTLAGGLLTVYTSIMIPRQKL